MAPPTHWADFWRRLVGGDCKGSSHQMSFHLLPSQSDDLSSISLRSSSGRLSWTELLKFGCSPLSNSASALSWQTGRSQNKWHFHVFPQSLGFGWLWIDHRSVGIDQSWSSSFAQPQSWSWTSADESLNSNLSFGSNLSSAERIIPLLQVKISARVENLKYLEKSNPCDLVGNLLAASHSLTIRNNKERHRIVNFCNVESSKQDVQSWCWDKWVWQARDTEREVKCQVMNFPRIWIWVKSRLKISTDCN